MASNAITVRYTGRAGASRLAALGVAAAADILLGAVSFMIEKHFFGLSLARLATADFMGAAGSVAGLLVWLYFSATIFMFSAQMAGAIGQRHQRDVSPSGTTNHRGQAS